MTLKEARGILGLGLTATRQEIQAAYRRAARRWHPDRAPAGAEAEYRARMQEVNAAYHRLREFLEDYRFRLEETAAPLDYQSWWEDRFNTGVWGGRPRSADRKKDK
ncbi:MAG: J domain-containing protein [Deltaproteobacteria bacterium]|nr:J domain-containing protein [Deltaproteobacteria bacterium]